MAARLLLISNSYMYNRGYLDHCFEEILDFLGATGRLLFIPYALRDWAEYTQMTRGRLRQIGYTVDSIHEASDPHEAVLQAQAILVGGGNTFRLLKTLYDCELVGPLQTRALGGTPYIGISAGANVACPTIQTTNDMPIVYPPTLKALQLISFQINPHYLDSDPSCKYMGETREMRIREYHEENDWPVVGLREGSLLRLEGRRLHLKGSTGARLFLKDKLPQELVTGDRLDSLLNRSS